MFSCMKLVLFDIDGTLMDSGGAGTRAMDLAFRELFSIDNAFGGIRMAGKTDMQIMKEALSGKGLSVDDGLIPEATAAYVRHLKAEIINDGKRLKPGVLELLGLLASMREVRLGLLTGNIEEGARVKLGAFGLLDYFSMGNGPSPARALVGAFGSDHEDRNMLLPLAIRKFASLSGLQVDCRDCIVVGDTPRDVQCAKPYGALAVGVATGPYGAEELARAGADLVMEDLTDGSVLCGLAGKDG
jgi:phosphoglycolate phosphatase